MTEKTIKSNYKKKYPSHLPKEDYQLYQKWQHTKHQPRQYFYRKQIEKELRHKGYGYLVGDLPKKGEISKKEYQMILHYRYLVNRKDLDSAKLVRQALRDVGLGVFAGDSPTLQKPSLKERVLSAENIVSFSNAINAEVLGFIDTEFTMRRHETLSIGCVLFDTKTQKTHQFYSTTHPVYEKKLSRHCIELTHLTQQEIDEAPDFSMMWQQFQDFLNKHQATYLMVWGSSDSVSLKTSMSFARMSFKARDDMLARVIDIQPIISLSRDETRLQFSLQDMKEYYHIKGNVEHHALQDAIDLKDVVLAFKKEHLEKFKKTEEVQ